MKAIKFQVVPPCGGHLKIMTAGLAPCQFQVVPPCGGHLFKLVFKAVNVRVSSRAPVWGASIFQSGTGNAALVSSRAPVWGASVARGGTGKGSWFQVVPPCGGHPV